MQKGMDNPFVRWWVTFSIISVTISTVLCGGMGAFIIASDRTWLSWGIIAVFLGASIHLGYGAKRYAGRKLLKEDIVKDYGVTNYFIDTCTSLGLLGTIIGLIMMIVGAFSDLDISNQDSIKSALVAMSAGIGTALVTTLVGLVCALLLRLQLVVVSERWRA